MNEWSVYIIRCDNGSLYTGISTDVSRRLCEHVSGDPKGARYMRPFTAVSLVYETRVDTRSMALKIEHRIKKLTKAEKERLVSSRLTGEALLRFLGVAPAE
jgi:putative endonuclease